MLDSQYVFYLSKHSSTEEARNHLGELNDASPLALNEVESEIVDESVATRIRLGYRGGQPRIRTTSKPQFRKLLWLITGAVAFLIAQSSDDPGMAAALGFISGFAVMVAIHIWYEREWDW